MKEISLTQGKVALVDDDMFECLNRRKWCAKWDGRHWYAARGIRGGGKLRTIRMHRVILGAQPGQEVDHRNMNGLDNQRKNLRICTQSQNSANQKKRAGCTSRYKGVDWHKQTGKWRARIRVRGELIHLGLFDDEAEAAKAYNRAAIEAFRDFARVNVMAINA